MKITKSSDVTCTSPGSLPENGSGAGMSSETLHGKADPGPDAAFKGETGDGSGSCGGVVEMSLLECGAGSSSRGLGSRLNRHVERRCALLGIGWSGGIVST